MKKIKKSDCPGALAQYIKDFPVADNKHTWQEFCEETKRKKEIQQRIKSDQRGLCAYCEMRFHDN